MTQAKFTKISEFKIRGILALGLILGVFCVFFLHPVKAEALNNSNVISDPTFTNYNSMDEAAIQSFLTSKGSYLAGFHETRSNLMGVPEREQAQGKSAAYIINWVAKEYGLNPQVIIATLQKEQTLITNSALSSYGLDFAMGYGCFESMGCQDGNSYQGFSRQVDWGAWQLRFNQLGANNTPLSKFSTATCNSVYPYCTGYPITIDGQNFGLDNGATASLYRYTPHIQNGFNDIFYNWFPAGPVLNISPVYRFYNVTNDTHFYTASEAEKNNIIAKWPNIYHFEGFAYNVSALPTSAPVYRFWNNNGTHFYTVSEAEKNNIMARWGNIFHYEGLAYYVSPYPTNNNVYRFYNKSNGTHFFTASASERDNIMARWGYIYQYEGTAWFLP